MSSASATPVTAAPFVAAWRTGALSASVFTVARLALIPVMISSFLVLPAVTTLALVLFVVADIYDGALARRLGAESPGRRALDSTVDRVAIDSCLVAAAAAGAMPFYFLVAFLVRDAYCGAICAREFLRRRVVIKADWMYRGLNLSVAVWAIAAPFLSAGGRIAFAGLVLAAGLLVAVDLTRSIKRIQAAPSQVRGVIIPAGVLRRGQMPGAVT